MVPYSANPSDESLELTTRDGTKLFIRHWRSQSRGGPRAAVLIVHGLGEHSGRYGHVARLLNEAGYDVWAHDHRGFGKSGGGRAAIPQRNQLLDDAKFVFEWMAAKNDGARTLLLGHSMGGAIVARAVTGGWIAPDALVLSSPALKSHANALMRSVASIAEWVVPNLAAPHGLPLQFITHDAAILADAATDPLNHARITPRLTNFIFDAGAASLRDAGKLAIPTLIQAAGDDRLVDVRGVKEFAAAAPAGFCDVKVYAGLWHEIYNEREPDRTAVLSDLKTWLATRLG